MKKKLISNIKFLKEEKKKIILFYSILNLIATSNIHNIHTYEIEFDTSFEKWRGKQSTLKKIKELNAYFLWSLRRPKVKSTKLTNIFLVCSPFERTTDARLEIWECGSLSFTFSDFP